MSRVDEVCENTWEVYRTTEDVRLRERVHAILLSNEGRTRRDISEILFRPLDEIKGWIQAYADGGIEALKHYDAASAVANAALTRSTVDALGEAEPVETEGGLPIQTRDMLHECLKFSPRVFGRRTDVWSTRALADVLHTRLGEAVPIEDVRGYLQEANLARLKSKAEFLTERLSRTQRLAAAAAGDGEVKTDEAGPTTDSDDATPARAPGEASDTFEAIAGSAWGSTGAGSAESDSASVSASDSASPSEAELSAADKAVAAAAEAIDPGAGGPNGKTSDTTGDAAPRGMLGKLAALAGFGGSRGRAEDAA